MKYEFLILFLIVTTFTYQSLSSQILREGSAHIYTCEDTDTTAPSTVECNTKFTLNSIKYCYNYTLTECAEDDEYKEHNSSDCKWGNILINQEGSKGLRGTISHSIYNNNNDEYENKKKIFGEMNVRLICPIELFPKIATQGCHIYTLLDKSFPMGIFDNNRKEVETVHNTYKMCKITNQIGDWEIYIQCRTSNYELDCFNYDQDHPTTVHCELNLLQEWNRSPQPQDIC